MKKLGLTLASILFTSTLSLTGYAAEPVEKGVMPPALTEEQKTEMQKQYAEMEEKFNSLTDEQKNEIYDLFDKVNVAKIKILDKYVEFGIMTEEEVEAIEEHMAKKSEEIRSEGKLVGFKAPHCHKAEEKAE
ncbi:MAG: YckD family protein [Turicibacter sp.]|nr:YckD family protein [Turicibacter sp.]